MHSVSMIQDVSDLRDFTQIKNGNKMLNQH